MKFRNSAQNLLFLLRILFYEFLRAMTQPYVFKCLFCTWSILWFLGKQSFHKINSFRWKETFSFEMSFIFHDAFHHLNWIFPFEWRRVENDHVKNNTQRPNITFLVIFSQENLWGYVIWCSYTRCQPNSRFCFNWNTKIYNFDKISSFFKKHILWFYVSMNNAFFVHVCQSWKNLICYWSCLTLINTVIDNPLKKFSTLAKLKYHDIVIFLVVDFKKLGDVRVI